MLDTNLPGQELGNPVVDDEFLFSLRKPTKNRSFAHLSDPEDFQSSLKRKELRNGNMSHLKESQNRLSMFHKMNPNRKTPNEV